MLMLILKSSLVDYVGLGPELFKAESPLLSVKRVRYLLDSSDSTVRRLIRTGMVETVVMKGPNEAVVGS